MEVDIVNIVSSAFCVRIVTGAHSREGAATPRGVGALDERGGGEKAGNGGK